MSRTAVILSTVFIFGCDSPAEPDDRWEDPEKITFASHLSIDLTELCTDNQLGCWNRASSGLYWKDIELGTGATAAAGDSVWVHFTVWLPDGTVVEDTHVENRPIVFLLGGGFVLRGFDEGVLGMRVAGTRRLVIPPSLAYGRAGKVGVVPPLTTLVLEVKLLKVRRF